VASLFVHVTVPPFATVTLMGLYAEPAIATGLPPLPVQLAAADAGGLSPPPWVAAAPPPPHAAARISTAAAKIENPENRTASSSLGE
jgi:hypothetical protein